MSRRLVVLLATVFTAVAVFGSVTVGSAAPVQPDGIITGWIVVPNGAEFFAKDTHDTGTTTITATFSPGAVKGIPNLTEMDNVVALVAAMKAPDWGAAIVGSERLVFSRTLRAKFLRSGVNVDWVYQRLYARMDPGATPPSYVPRVPQSVNVEGGGAVAPVPKGVPASPTPVVVQHPATGTRTQIQPTPGGSSSPAASATSRNRALKQQPAQNGVPAKPAVPPRSVHRGQRPSAVVAVEPSAREPAVLVPGAYVTAGRSTDKRLSVSRLSPMEQDAIGGVAVAVLVGLFLVVERRRRAWPFCRGFAAGKALDRTRHPH